MPIEIHTGRIDTPPIRPIRVNDAANEPVPEAYPDRRRMDPTVAALIQTLNARDERHVTATERLATAMEDIRDRLPAPRRPEDSESSARLRVALRDAASRAFAGAAGAWIVRVTLVLLIMGTAGALGISLDVVQPGKEMPPLLQELLGYSAPVGDPSAPTSPTPPVDVAPPPSSARALAPEAPATAPTP